jgi:adenine-specific DNA methylase
MKFSRQWAMPNSNTFSVKPIGDFVKSYLSRSKVSIDMFSRDKDWATYTNDLNPNTTSMYHMDAEEFLVHLKTNGVVADLVLFDPPYSPRQISECYNSIA